MSKRRGRERKRDTTDHRHEVLYVGDFVVLVDTETGDVRHNLIPAMIGRDSRDRLTAAVIGLLQKWGWEPADQLEIRDILWED